MSDIRERPRYPAWAEVEEDEAKMVIRIGHLGQEFPAQFKVCHVCEGTGRHVNPSIDSNGISPEEFAADPDFAAAYFGGVYDVVCNHCGGKRVVLEPTTPEGREALDEILISDAQYRAEVEAERRMGA